ncbi:hypothetical protein BC828DRAFT_386070 [Blastocladiella britannica]|nr:hypothetical protein BC828DRAFT_386070 [Blastocladiella britannica]
MSSSSSSSTSHVPELQYKSPNDSLTSKAMAPVTTIAAKVDPWPHYIMGGASGIGAYVAHQMHGDPRKAAIAAGAAAAYYYAGYLLHKDHPEEKMAYDIGTLASVGLLVGTGGAAWTAGKAIDVSLASLGGISLLGNVSRAYQLRTGKPTNLPHGQEPHIVFKERH